MRGRRDERRQKEGKKKKRRQTGINVTAGDVNMSTHGIRLSTGYNLKLTQKRLEPAFFQMASRGQLVGKRHLIVWKQIKK